MLSRYTNLILLFFACIAVFLLIRYTDVANIGIAGSLNEGLANLKRIIYAPNPDPELTNAEKDKLKKTLRENSRQPLFCQSVYFPFIPGAKWRYQLAQGTDKDIIETGVPPWDGNLVYLDGRRLSREKWTIRTILQCVGGKIKTTDLNFLFIFRQDRLVTTPCEDGQFNFFLPRDIDLVKGNNWNQSGCLVHAKLDQNYNEKESETKENLTVRWKALGTETIDVPAGRFETQKLELDWPQSQVNIWISAGVGIIKIIEGTTIQELVEYQIPTEFSSKRKSQ
ncbi:MAG: hypothetical protein V1690_01605 [Candidatus Moraniibacteriota bacterium]